MKKLFFILATSILVLIITKGANAQTRFASTNNNMISNSSKPDNTTGVSAIKWNINTRALRKFYKDFPGITDDVWIKDKDGYVVRFTSNGIQNWAFLTNHGYCYTRMRYYTEKELPTDVRHVVKTAYYDFSIASIKEIVCNNSIVYLVTIEDKTNWKVIQVVGREMAVWEEHTKG